MELVWDSRGSTDCFIPCANDGSERKKISGVKEKERKCVRAYLLRRIRQTGKVGSWIKASKSEARKPCNRVKPVPEKVGKEYKTESVTHVTHAPARQTRLNARRLFRPSERAHRSAGLATKTRRRKGGAFKSGVFS